MGAKALYTNITNCDGIEAAEGSNETLGNRVIIAFFHIILTINNCSFVGSIYLQNKGS